MNRTASHKTATSGLSEEELSRLFHVKYGASGSIDWGPRLRLRYGYFTPDDIYEALVARLVVHGTSWLDVGSGRNIFPSNPALARTLAKRCELVVGVDPDDTIHENVFVHRKHQCTVEHLRTDSTFDLVTLRMVAEHITRPREAVSALARLTRPGGKIVIYTVNRWSPVAVMAYLVPSSLQHPIKRLLWKADAKDTFPVAYRMNTRKRLTRLLADAGCRELAFHYLDDCRTSAGYRIPQVVELAVWRMLYKVGLRYPENCLLGLYERTEHARIR